MNAVAIRKKFRRANGELSRAVGVIAEVIGAPEPLVQSIRCAGGCAISQKTLSAMSTIVSAVSTAVMESTSLASALRAAITKEPVAFDEPAVDTDVAVKAKYGPVPVKKKAAK